ncbi:nucleotidyltransferase [Noviherbaspirillum sp. CPCC 100848]|uniref:Nucleotidyltransferase n=1 Tax=Noviherbaspirillum album TaxID=3080276 RepID=A0ABU6JGI4_9BURK|nr:nucleotidyltransferase [Noviherbaspirillum sp. CPCC 100848]MEC4722767.1 nucleotidyltransferase [Noviherbaspirillum sp. CPCC 100848]
MPRTIEQGFADFHNNIKASAAEASATVSHRASIKTCLENKFGLKRFTRIGSFGNGTNISGYSDVDYLACLSTESLKQSSTYTLSLVRDGLNARFPHTGVHVSTPAVVCPFGTYKSQHTEIVVVDYIKERNGYKIYEMADGEGGWMEICPDAHNLYVHAVDKKHSGKVKPLIQFIKAWKYYRSVPISSFYLEMRVAKYADSEKAIIYDIDVKRILAMLRDNELAGMQDPTGAAGYIYPCKTEAFKQDALSKLATAAARAEKARSSTANNDIKDAFDWWRLLYNDKFPTYYL